VTWQTVPLGELYVRRGTVSPRSGSSYSLYSVPSYETGAPEFLDGGGIGSAKQRVRPGDVLLCRIVPHIRRAWVVSDHEAETIASTEWIVLAHPAVDSGYLRHFLLSDPFHAEFMSTLAGVGGSLSRARPTAAARIPVPLPPLPEQRRIAAILDEADAVRNQLRRAKQVSADAPRDLFTSTFGRVDQLQRADGTRDLSLLASVIDCPHSTPAWESAGVTCIRTSNLGKGEWDWSDHRYVSESTHAERTRRSELFEGDIVLSREGTVGLAAIVPFGLRMSMGQRLVQVRPDKSQIEPEYLLHYLLQATSPQVIGHLMVGSTSTHLNVRDLRSLRVFVPPRGGQQRFAAQVRAIARVRDAGRTRANALDGLFATLQHRAFRGEL